MDNLQTITIGKREPASFGVHELGRAAYSGYCGASNETRKLAEETEKRLKLLSQAVVNVATTGSERNIVDNAQKANDTLRDLAELSSKPLIAA